MLSNNVVAFFVNPNKIEEIFSEFNEKNPFSLRSEYKDYIKSVNTKDVDICEANLADEIKTAYHVSTIHNVLYFSSISRSVFVLKLRIKDEAANSGKSNGWRVIGLVDIINGIFYLFSIYKHSFGKDNLSPNEVKAMRNICDEYANELKGARKIYV